MPIIKNPDTKPKEELHKRRGEGRSAYLLSRAEN
jgi:hypothetical protein